MSEQSNGLNKVLREGGIPVPPPPAAVENSEESQPEIPAVELPREGRQLSAFARELGAIASTNGVFRREMVPVTINAEQLTMDALTPDRFRTYAETIAMPFKYKIEKRKDPATGAEERIYHKMPCTMQVDAARGTLMSDQFILQQRSLAKINAVRQPVIRKDGRIELLPQGYDKESEIYTMQSDVCIEEWELDRAVIFLRKLHEEFPLDARGLAVHLAAMLSLFGSSLQEVTEQRMNFVYRSNSPGGGKGLLVKLCVIPVMGMCNVQTIPDSKEEFRKTLDSAAIGSVPYLFFDELEGNLKNNDLNAFMTTDYRTGRLMNSQRMFTCPKITICFLAGNNLSLSPDVARRTLMADLYVQESDIRDRTIKNVLSSKHLAKPAVRGDILSALWALIRFWDKAGRPGSSRVAPTFEDWSHLYGGIVEHAGFGSPLEPPADDTSPNTEDGDMKALVADLAKGLGIPDPEFGRVDKKQDYEFNQVIARCRELNAFSWIIDGKISKDTGEFECTHRAAAVMGKLFAGRFGGTIFRVKTSDDPDAKVLKVMFGKRGKNRHRKYSVEVID